MTPNTLHPLEYALSRLENSPLLLLRQRMAERATAVANPHTGNQESPEVSRPESRQA